MIYFKNKKFRTGRKTCIVLALLLIAVVLMAAYFNSQIDKIMDSVVKKQVENKITEIVNEAVATLSEDPTYASENFVSIRYSSDGKIASISADSALINRMRAEISSAVAQGLNEMEAYGVPITYANLFGEGFFSSFLPETYLTVKVKPFGGVNTDVESELVSAGINQSKHTVELKIDAGVAGLVRDQTIEVRVSTSVCIAETVIVGEVPSIWLGSRSLS